MLKILIYEKSVTLRVQSGQIMDKQTCHSVKHTHRTV